MISFKTYCKISGTKDHENHQLIPVGENGRNDLCYIMWKEHILNIPEPRFCSASSEAELLFIQVRECSYTPQSKNVVSTIQITCRVLSFCHGKFLKWWADDQSFSIPKGSTYSIKNMYIQPFSMEVDWGEIWHKMDVSTMFYICRYCVFTLWGRVLPHGIRFEASIFLLNHTLVPIPWTNTILLFCKWIFC